MLLGSTDSPANSQGQTGLIRPVILCGGSGTRLWPLSRSLYPKQLCPVSRRDTMLQATVERARNPMFSDPVVVAREDHGFLVKDQIEAIGASCAAIILEPAGRNTAPAIALAAHWALQSDPDQVLLVMPCDHVISDSAAFASSVAEALPAAQAGFLVTFGIKPARPETGYGYIETGDSQSGGSDALPVVRFVEKPGLAEATDFCSSGRHFWNSGIFMFRASTIIEELVRLAPAIAENCERSMASPAREDPFIRPEAEPFLGCTSISIDYAVMEKTDRAVVMPSTMQWSDVGSWAALWEISDRDANDNAVQGDVIAIGCRGSLLRSDAGITVAAVGLEELVVVATSDAVLVVPRERSQDTKLIVKAMKASGRDKHSVHPKVHRPWGSYETMDHGDRFQTKRIIVKPGQRLSLQRHHQRSEHWIVVGGTALATVDGEVRLLQENDSTYIPAGSVHRLENPGKIPLHLIEVQCGPYLGEDDIVRLEDDYGRIESVA